MSTHNNNSYQDPRNVSLKGGASGSGLLRWDPGAANWGANPFETTDYGLYINLSGQLVFSSLGSATVLGSGGGGGSFNVPTSATDGTSTTGNSLAIAFSALTTGSGFYGSVSTGFTTGGAVFNAALGARTAGNGFVATTTGVYTGTGLLVLTANSATTGVIAQINGTGITTGSALSILGGTSMTAATGELLNLNLGAAAVGQAFTITTTGAYTDVAGIISIIANNLTVGSIEVASATSQTTGVLYSITGGGANITSGGILMDLEMGGAVAGIGLKVLTSGALAGSNNLAVFSAASATTTTGIVSIVGTALTSGVGLLMAGGAAAGTGALASITGGYTTGAGNTVKITSVATTGGAALAVVGNSATSANVVTISATAQTSGAALLVTGGGANVTSGSAVAEVTMGGATTGIGLLVTSTGNFSGTGANAVLSVVANSLTSGIAAQISATALTTGTAFSLGTLAALTTGIGFSIAHTTSVIASGGSLVSLSSTSIDTGTTHGVLLDLISTASLAGTQVLLTASALTTGIAASIVTAALTTGSALSISAAAATTGSILKVTATAATLTTGFYFAAYDGGLNVFTVGRNGHLTSNQTTAPTVAVGTQNGITAAAITAGSTDTNGNITTTGTSTGGTIFTVTFNQTYTVAPKIVILTPANAAGAAPNTQPYVSSITATTFVVTIPGSGTYAATPSYNYLVIA
jgi:hypothetical protein